MDNQGEFTEVPKAEGFNTRRIMLIAGLLISVGSILAIFAIFQKPGSSVSQSQQELKETRTMKPIAVKSSDDEISKIINSSQTPSVSTNLAVSQSNNNESAVPPIISVKQASQISDASTTNDNLQKQIMQASDQARLKRVQAKYAAYSSKTLINITNTKTTASGTIRDSNSLLSPIKPTASGVLDKNKFTSSSKIIPAKTPYELIAGSFIPCVMISGLNSEISGTIKGQVTENVYNTVNGKYLLIPQGSMIIGTYNNTVLYGNNRIGVAWNMLMLPNGSTIDLQALPGSDLEGFTGFSDIVDNHYWYLFGSSFIMGVITAGMQYSQNDTNANVQSGGVGFTNPNPTVGQTVSGSLGQQMGQTGLAVTNKALNVAPTIIIRQGMQFNIMLTATLALKPYKG